jgi:hypothetical protein
MSSKRENVNKVMDLGFGIKTSRQNRYNIMSEAYNKFKMRKEEIKDLIDPNDEYDLDQAIANVKLAMTLMGDAYDAYEKAYEALVEALKDADKLLDQFETDIQAEELPNFELSDVQKLAISRSRIKDKERLEYEAIEDNKLKFIRFFVTKTKGKPWEERFGSYKTADILRLIAEYAKEHRFLHTDGSYESRFWMTYQAFVRKYDILIRKEKIEF